MKAIAAMSNNRVIGKDGRIPWKCKEDLKFFKRMTVGGMLIMGNTTFKNVGLLPERHTFVLTRNLTTPKFILSDEDDIVAQYGEIKDIPETTKEVWVCGGASVYKQLLPQCSDLYLTIILDDYDGDTYMPDFEHLFPQQRALMETKGYWIVHYWQKTSLIAEAQREGFDAAWMGQARRDNPYGYPAYEYGSGFPAELHEAWERGWSEGANKKFEISIERAISQVRI